MSLYLHIPYCRALCHYCDFAKTANFAPALPGAYVGHLRRHLVAWLSHPSVRPRVASGFITVFFGGGTPSLLGAEYAPLMDDLRPLLAPGCEVTFEANPDDVTADRLALWRSLGVNRLSLGVQTFEPAGLGTLRRIHGPAQAVAAIAAARAVFPNLNVDLIYGWPGQDLAAWRRDLRQVLALDVRHLSLYALTYEGRTPLARAAQRGKVTPAADEVLADLYAEAVDRLGAAGFDHEEVSNWAKPGASCRHNWVYWQDGAYLGIGAGAHGYLAEPDGPGLRYAYPRSDRTFLRHAPHASHELNATELPLGERFGVTVESERDQASWLTEVVAGGLRTTRGVAIGAALARTGKTFVPTPALQEALARSFISIDPLEGTSRVLRLSPGEWFREAGWAVEVLRSCVDPA